MPELPFALDNNGVLASFDEDGDGEVTLGQSLASVELIDSFEGDTVDDNFSGDTSLFGFDSGNTQNGGQSLTSTANGTVTSDNSTISDGQGACLYIRTNGNDDTLYFYFGLKDVNNTYFVEIDPAADTLTIGSLVDGVGTDIASGSVTFDATTWYQLFVDWQNDGTLTAEVYDEGATTQIGSVSGSDTTYTTGSVGYGATDAGINWDYVRVCTGITLAPTGPRPAGVIDDFEDGDIDEYYNDTGIATVQSSVVFEGSNALELESAGDGGTQWIISESGLPTYPQAGDNFKYRFRVGSSITQGAIKFGYQDSNNHILLSAGPSTFYLREYVGGSIQSSASSSPSMPTNEWLKMEISWQESGAMTATLEEEDGTLVDELSITANRIISGGIAWQEYTQGSGNPDTTVHFDAAEITSTTDSTGVIDDFEDNDLSEYTLDGPDVGISSSVVNNGSFSARIAADSANSSQRIRSFSGLPLYPQAGDTFQYYFYPDGDGPLSFFYFGAPSPGSGYRLLFNHDGPGQEIQRGGTTIASNSLNPSGSLNQWLRAVVDWQEDGTIDWTVYEPDDSVLFNLTATDTTYKGGGIELYTFHQRTGTPRGSWYDDIEITASSDQPAPRVIDQFNDNDFSEYVQENSFNGSETSSPSIEGSSMAFSNGRITSYPGDGLDYYPSAGDLVSVWYRPGDIFTNFNFNVAMAEGEPDGYRMEAREDTDRISLLKLTSSGGNTLASTGVTISANNWYKLELSWGDSGNLVYTIYDSGESQLAQVSATDGEYTDGGVRLRAFSNSGSNRFVDLFEAQENGA